jgi:hypothetical protein
MKRVLVLIPFLFLVLVSCSKLDVSERALVISQNFDNQSIMPERFTQFGSGLLAKHSKGSTVLPLESEGIYTIRLSSSNGEFKNVFADLYNQNGELVASNYAKTAKGTVKFHDAWIYRCSEAGNFKLVLDTKKSEADIKYALGVISPKQVLD